MPCWSSGICGLCITLYLLSLGLSTHLHGLPPLLAPVLLAICMSASHLLVEAIRTAIVGLRTLASGLEAALNQFSSAASTQVPIHDVEVPEDRVVVPPASPLRAPEPPLSTFLLESALEWITNETASRVHFYSAVEEEVMETPAVTRKKPTKSDAPKPKKITTAALADQLASLTETLPAITNQLTALRQNQERLEGALVQVRDAPRPAPPHQQDFPVPPLPDGTSALGSFVKAVGSAPRTKLSTPLRQQMGAVLIEDEPLLQPDQEGYKPAANVNMDQMASGSTAQALVQQSQAMTALVAHLINQDASGDLSLSGLGGSSLSSKGTARRERLQTELQNRSGGFMLNVAQTAFKRMRPTDVVPSSLAGFQGRSHFTRYFEKQGGYMGQKDLSLVQWMMAHIADALLNEDFRGAHALGLVSIDQASQDSGKWDVAWTLSLLEDPPPGMMSSRGKQTNPRLAAFSPICPQGWATTSLQYIKEMDLIALRRSEAAGASRKTPKSEEETDRPAPKRRPRFPKKPKQNETS